MVYINTCVYVCVCMCAHIHTYTHIHFAMVKRQFINVAISKTSLIDQFLGL